MTPSRVKQPVVGVILLDERVKRVPGDVGHKDTYPFHVVFRVAKGIRATDLVDHPTLRVKRAFQSAALSLVKEGAKIIATSCGFSILLQKFLSWSVNATVLTSALLSIPLLRATYGEKGKIGIVTSDSRMLNLRHLRAAGVEPDEVAVGGLENVPSFYDGILRGEFAEFNKVTSDLVNFCRKMVLSHRNIRAIVLECANLHPYAESIRRHTSLPVIDIMSLIEFFANQSIFWRSYGRYSTEQASSDTEHKETLP